jgi:hypothetical protein
MSPWIIRCGQIMFGNQCTTVSRAEEALVVNVRGGGKFNLTEGCILFAYRNLNV